MAGDCPVAKAVAVMEALHLQSPLLFPVEAFTGTSTPKSLGSAVPPHMVNDRIEEFVDWCNAAAARPDRKQDIIPTDPEGNVTTSRFRRTLAWFIYRKPGGRIALGVQYGHLRGHTTDGYGSRVAVGLRDVFPMEEALARADYLEDAYTHMEEGEQVSGPAAGRYREAVRLYGQEFRGRYMSGKQAAALRANPRLRIYDNSTRFVTCCYDQSKALCHPDRLGPLGTEETPDINHCQPNCGNIARTDRNIEQAAETIARHQAEMASPLTLSHCGPPGPTHHCPANDHRHPHRTDKRWPKTESVADRRQRQQIRDAMDRLIAGTALHSDGKLTVKSLAEEAQVKRWVLTHRHTRSAG